MDSMSNAKIGSKGVSGVGILMKEDDTKTHDCLSGGIDDSVRREQQVSGSSFA